MRTRSIAILLVVAAALGTAAFVLAGLNGVSTRSEPSIAERFVAGIARRWAVPRQQRQATNPVAFSPEVWAEARAHFADHCASCHGNDGRGNTEMGRNLYPKAPDMRLEGTQHLTDGELYWVIENGLRLTGMPAWGDGSGTDLATWKLVHFIRHLNDLTPEQLAEMAAFNPKSPSELEEERQDQNFLEGKDLEGAAPAPSHHDH